MYFRFVKDVMFASRPVTGDANKASTQSGSTKSSTWTEGVVCTVYTYDTSLDFKLYLTPLAVA